MTTAFDIVYPPKGRLTFDGGQNSKFERSIIKDNESPSCLNVVFTNGAAETRGGSTKLNTTAIGSFVGDGLYTRHDNNGGQTMIAWAGGTAWQWTGATFSTISSAQSVFTAGVRVAAAEYENHIFFGNGGSIPMKWNGTAFTRHGVYPPTTTASVASNGAGNLAGEYAWKVTFVNSAAVESDVGPAATFTVTATGGQVNVTNIPVAPASFGISARRLYRTDAGGSTFKRVTEIADNSTTSYVDNIASSAVGVNAPTDNGVPPKYNAIVAHQGRMFFNDALNPNFVWYSEIYEPYTVKATNFQPVGDASFDLLQGGLAVYENALYIGGAGASYLWYMPTTDPNDWSLIRTRSPFGNKSPFGNFLYNNKLMVPAMQSSKFVGFAAISGSTIDPEATLLDAAKAGSDLKSDRIEDEIFDVQEALVGNISAMVFKNKAYIAVTHGSGNTQNNRIYIFDFSISNLKKSQEASWVPVDGIRAAQFTVYDGKLYYIDSTATGFVRQLETDVYSDDGEAIDSFYWTKEYSGKEGHENLEKDFRFVKILVEKTGNYFMNLTARTDSDSGDGVTYQVDLNPGSTLWGQFSWGMANYGGGANQEEIRIPLGLRGKRIQFRFSNQDTAGQRFKVHGMNFNYNIKGKR